jgi:hypothetical protein
MDKSNIRQHIATWFTLKIFWRNIVKWNKICLAFGWVGYLRLRVVMRGLLLLYIPKYGINFGLDMSDFFPCELFETMFTFRQ